MESGEGWVLEQGTTKNFLNSGVDQEHLLVRRQVVGLWWRNWGVPAWMVAEPTRAGLCSMSWKEVVDPPGKETRGSSWGVLGPSGAPFDKLQGGLEFLLRMQFHSVQYLACEEQPLQDVFVEIIKNSKDYWVLCKLHWVGWPKKSPKSNDLRWNAAPMGGHAHTTAAVPGLRGLMSSGVGNVR